MSNYPFKIPTATRILIILQLCLGLSCLLWILGYPFMGNRFKTQSEIVLIESVMGNPEMLTHLDPNRAKKMEEISFFNKSLFERLPPEIKKNVLLKYEIRQNLARRPFFDQIGAALDFFIQVPLLEILWMILAIAIPILLLLRNKSALTLVWLLPLVTAGYGFNNYYRGIDPLKNSDISLFPKESELLMTNMTSYEDALMTWENFLIQNYSKHPLERNERVREGEFYFNLKRIEHLNGSLSDSFWERKSSFLLILYLIWNGGFAVIISRALAGGNRQKSLQNNQTPLAL